MTTLAIVVGPLALLLGVAALALDFERSGRPAGEVARGELRHWPAYAVGLVAGVLLVVVTAAVI